MAMTCANTHTQTHTLRSAPCVVEPGQAVNLAHVFNTGVLLHQSRLSYHRISGWHMGRGPESSNQTDFVGPGLRNILLVHFYRLVRPSSGLLRQCSSRNFPLGISSTDGRGHGGWGYVIREAVSLRRLAGDIGVNVSLAHVL